MAELSGGASEFADPGLDRAQPETVEVIRSEERLRTSTRRVPVQRARLEKFEVTEMQTITVPVTREDVRIVYEPVEAGTADGQSDPRVTPPGAKSDSESAPWVLTAERVVVTKEKVPVETVKLVVETVSGEQEVTEEVRKEQVTLQTVPAVQEGRSS